MAKQLCLLGATESEIASAFGVSDRTIGVWKQKHPKFKEALQEGRIHADAYVAEQLFKRATGYEHPETKVFCDKGKIITFEVTKHYPPDTTAAIIWLKNRRPNEWRERRNYEISGPDGKPIETIATNMTPEEAAQLYADTLKDD